jgi:hypothetical protein
VSTMEIDPKPRRLNGMPYCSLGVCKHYNKQGESCDLISSRPGLLCEPVIRQMIGALVLFRTGYEKTREVKSERGKRMADAEVCVAYLATCFALGKEPRL